MRNISQELIQEALDHVTGKRQKRVLKESKEAGFRILKEGVISGELDGDDLIRFYAKGMLKEGWYDMLRAYLPNGAGDLLSESRLAQIKNDAKLYEDFTNNMKNIVSWNQDLRDNFRAQGQRGDINKAFARDDDMHLNDINRNPKEGFLVYAPTRRDDPEEYMDNFFQEGVFYRACHPAVNQVDLNKFVFTKLNGEVRVFRWSHRNVDYGTSEYYDKPVSLNPDEKPKFKIGPGQPENLPAGQEAYEPVLIRAIPEIRYFEVIKGMRQNPEKPLQ